MAPSVINVLQSLNSIKYSNVGSVSLDYCAINGNVVPECHQIKQLTLNSRTPKLVVQPNSLLSPIGICCLTTTTALLMQLMIDTRIKLNCSVLVFLIIVVLLFISLIPNFYNLFHSNSIIISTVNYCCCFSCFPYFGCIILLLCNIIIKIQFAQHCEKSELIIMGKVNSSSSSNLSLSLSCFQCFSDSILLLLFLLLLLHTSVSNVKLSIYQNLPGCCFLMLFIILLIPVSAIVAFLNSSLLMLFSLFSWLLTWNRRMAIPISTNANHQETTKSNWHLLSFRLFRLLSKTFWTSNSSSNRTTKKTTSQQSVYSTLFTSWTTLLISVLLVLCLPVCMGNVNSNYTTSATTYNSTSSPLNQTIVQAYPEIIALKGSQVAIPCNISHSIVSPGRQSTSTTANVNSESSFESTIPLAMTNSGPVAEAETEAEVVNQLASASASFSSSYSSSSSISNWLLFSGESINYNQSSYRSNPATAKLERHQTNARKGVQISKSRLRRRHGSRPTIPRKHHDQAKLILWYYGDDISGSPIYTVDARDSFNRPNNGNNNNNGTTNDYGRHFVDSKLKGRARVDFSVRPVQLIIDQVGLNDSGTYWCRADFRWTRTLISTVQLNVHVEPELVHIWSQNSELQYQINKSTVAANLSNSMSPMPWSENDDFLNKFVPETESLLYSSSTKNTTTKSSSFYYSSVSSLASNLLSNLGANNNANTNTNNTISLHLVVPKAPSSTARQLLFSNANLVQMNSAQLLSGMREDGAQTIQTSTQTIAINLSETNQIKLNAVVASVAASTRINNNKLGQFNRPAISAKTWLPSSFPLSGSTSSSSSLLSSPSSSSSNDPVSLITANEGANLELFCEAYGGIPLPSVTWLVDMAQSESIVGNSNRNDHRPQFFLLDVCGNMEQNVMGFTSQCAIYNGTVQYSANHTHYSLDGGQIQLINDYQQPMIDDKNRSSWWWWKWKWTQLPRPRTISKTQPINKSVSSLAPNANQVIINRLKLFNLNRNLSGARFVCLVNNTGMASKRSKTFQLDLNLNPSKVTILPPTGLYLSDGLKTEVTCRAYAARPFALISWFLDKQNITHLSDYNLEANSTQSVLKLMPKWTDDQKQLTCVAYNPVIPQHQPTNIVNDSIILDIKYVPQIKLIVRKSYDYGNEKETSLSPESTDMYFLPNFAQFNQIMIDQLRYVHVEEGGNLTLDCLLIAKPPVTVVRWTQNLAQIWHETEGIVIKNQSLIIVGAKRGVHEGNFRCVAFNSEGRGVSNEIRILVDYAPRCAESNNQQKFRVSLGDPVKFRCKLDANPSNNVTFYWTVNNQINKRLKQIPDLELDANEHMIVPLEDGNTSEDVHVYHWQHQSRSLQSLVQLVPGSMSDYGIVRCWARNSVGYQATPCIFHLEHQKSSNDHSRMPHSSASSSLSSSPMLASSAENNQPQNFASHLKPGLSGTETPINIKPESRPNRWKQEKFAVFDRDLCLVNRSTSSIVLNCSFDFDSVMEHLSTETSSKLTTESESSPLLIRYQIEIYQHNNPSDLPLGTKIVENPLNIQQITLQRRNLNPDDDDHNLSEHLLKDTIGSNWNSAHEMNSKEYYSSLRRSSSSCEVHYNATNLLSNTSYNIRFRILINLNENLEKDEAADQSHEEHEDEMNVLRSFKEFTNNSEHQPKQQQLFSIKITNCDQNFHQNNYKNQKPESSKSRGGEKISTHTFLDSSVTSSSMIKWKLLSTDFISIMTLSDSTDNDVDYDSSNSGEFTNNNNNNIVPKSLTDASVFRPMLILFSFTAWILLAVLIVGTIGVVCLKVKSTLQNKKNQRQTDDNKCSTEENNQSQSQPEDCSGGSQCDIVDQLSSSPSTKKNSFCNNLELDPDSIDQLQTIDYINIEQSNCWSTSPNDDPFSHLMMANHNQLLIETLDPEALQIESHPFHHHHHQQSTLQLAGTPTAISSHQSAYFTTNSQQEQLDHNNTTPTPLTIQLSQLNSHSFLDQSQCCNSSIDTNGSSYHSTSNTISTTLGSNSGSLSSGPNNQTTTIQFQQGEKLLEIVELDGSTGNHSILFDPNQSQFIADGSVIAGDQLGTTTTTATYLSQQGPLSLPLYQFNQNRLDSIDTPTSNSPNNSSLIPDSSSNSGTPGPITSTATPTTSNNNNNSNVITSYSTCV